MTGKTTQLVDMKRDAPDPDSGAECMPCEPESGEQYPWGLNISLGTPELQKLGIEQLPAIGTEVRGSFVAYVTSARQELNDAADSSLTLQICQLQTTLAAGPPPAEDPPVVEARPGQLGRIKKPSTIVS